jgi:TrmH family RNA methyltransferase
MEVYQAENEETLEFLQKNSFNIYTTLWMKLLKIFTKDFTQRSAVLFGTEHSGLSDFWIGRKKYTDSDGRKH